MDSLQVVVVADARRMMGARMEFAVDIVVPVYNAPEDVRDCVASVLAHLRPDARLVLIDDASPDPAVGAYLATLASRAGEQLVLLRNEHNLGFTGTANRGMQLSRADVVLLNSDTIVTRGWLDALMECAASDATIGTITPFSNNAEICSFPVFCADNPWPAGGDPEVTRSALANAAVPTYPDLPTGVGFCMYVRRTLLDAIGPFDLAFGKGYGEENDFCLRAHQAGYRNVLADNAFVVHTGGRSFAGQKAELGVRNLALLVDRHPHYNDMVRDYIVRDPLRPLRDAAAAVLARSQSPTHGVLHVIHDHGGGTETHVRALIASSQGRWRHYLAIAVADRWQIEEHRAGQQIVTFDLTRNAGESWRAFLGGICATFGIGLIHLHNISGSREGVLDALHELPVPFGYTVHDLNFACPTITFLNDSARYCGAQTDELVCGACLRAQPAFERIDIASWRAAHRKLLERAAFLIAPSRWAAQTLLRYFPATDPQVIAHGAGHWERSGAKALRLAALMPADGKPTVAILGAIGPDKGARRIERLVELARQAASPLRFVVIGYTDVEPGPWQSDDAMFTVHGRYAPDDLPDLLEHYRAALVLYPSAGPETFSYTLTEAWAAGRPVLVPPFGALAERVEPTRAGWIMTQAQWEDEAAMLARLTELLATANASELADAARAARDVPHATAMQMTDATFALYERALSEAPVQREIAQPLARDRIRAALGYAAWRPPVPITTAIQPASNVPATAPALEPRMGSGIARLALQMRPTLLGRILFRVTPQSVLTALKARLRS